MSEGRYVVGSQEERELSRLLYDDPEVMTGPRIGTLDQQREWLAAWRQMKRAEMESDRLREERDHWRREAERLEKVAHQVARGVRFPKAEIPSPKDEA